MSKQKGITRYASTLHTTYYSLTYRVLQWTYITANSRGTYPETFWNCADVTVEPEGYGGETGCAVGAPAPPSLPAPAPAPVLMTNWCSTKWSEYGSGLATCTPCATTADCLAGRSCWAATFCKDTVLCGDANDADCQVSVASAPPAAPSPPDTCAPDGAWACTDALQLDTASGCAAFASACTAYCGDCEGVAAGVRATTTCAAPAPWFPEGTVSSTCSCSCGANADCVVTPKQQCSWLLTPPPAPLPPTLPPSPPSSPPLLPLPPLSPNPPLGDAVNIIGYWGNSGAAQGRLPRIAELHPNYNVVILTFANLADSGELIFEVQADKACCAAGAAYQSMDDLKAELAAWKVAPDPWGRRRTGTSMRPNPSPNYGSPLRK